MIARWCQLVVQRLAGDFPDVLAQRRAAVSRLALLRLGGRLRLVAVALAVHAVEQQA